MPPGLPVCSCRIIYKTRCIPFMECSAALRCRFADQLIMAGIAVDLTYCNDRIRKEWSRPAPASACLCPAGFRKGGILF